MFLHNQITPSKLPDVQSKVKKRKHAKQVISRHIVTFANRTCCFYAMSFKPLPFLPISQTPHTVHTVPLYELWNLLPSKAQVSNEEPE